MGQNYDIPIGFKNFCFIFIFIYQDKERFLSRNSYICAKIKYNYYVGIGPSYQ